MNHLDPRQLQSAVMHLLSADGFAWLTEKRWFADKGKSIEAIDIVDLSMSILAEVRVLLCIIDVQFHEGGQTRYFLPLIVEGPSNEKGQSAKGASDSPNLVDAVTQPEIGRWLAELFSTSGSQLGSNGWSTSVAPAALPQFCAQQNLDGRPVGGEQSNSSVQVGEDVVVKVLRRLEPGVNPEDEVLRALSEFDQVRVSTYLGSLYWFDEKGIQFTAAIAQKWVPNQGDGWSWTLEQLRRASLVGGVDRSVICALRDLGVRTAELHIALGAAQAEAFGTQTATSDDVAQVQAGFHTSLERSMALLSEAQARLPPDLESKLPHALVAMSGLEKLSEGFAVEAGAARIRVHGDYHLGQVLRTIDDDWTIIDFEGEPARSLDERRMHSAPLRDVAGMLRSFSYARAVADQRLVADAHADVQARDVLRDWERRAREAFIDGYRTTLASIAPESGIPLVPRSDAAFNIALAAWEADKALYEVAYEARNRPEWIGIPLGALVPELFDQA